MSLDYQCFVDFKSTEMVNMEKKEKEKKAKKSKVDAKEAKIIELTDSLQHLQAEFENYKKYVEKQKQEYAQYAKGDVISKMLPFIDTFEQSLKHKAASEAFVKGVEMLHEQLVQLLEQEGLRAMVALGKPSDPHYHDIMLTEESDKADRVVLEELQKGYMLHDKVLRHAKVKVAKKGGSK